MRPTIAIFDEFLDNPQVVQKDILDGQFLDIVNPIDGVTYPGINTEIPGYVSSTLVCRLSEIMGRPVSVVALFARLTTKALSEAPHKIHSDKVMSDYSCHIYLSSFWPENAGTSFWIHKTEGGAHTDKTDVEQIKKDQGSTENWDQTFFVQGDFNRLLIHDSRLWHCAEPVGGWGDSPQNGRVVLTCFFNAGGA